MRWSICIVFPAVASASEGELFCESSTLGLDESRMFCVPTVTSWFLEDEGAHGNIHTKHLSKRRSPEPAASSQMPQNAAKFSARLETPGTTERKHIKEPNSYAKTVDIWNSLNDDIKLKVHEFKEKLDKSRYGDRSCTTNPA
ncbi:hypothetical protein E2C01_001256 [Portunus trituberculatus]|uniref:Uncharacterized protein n=1 Tax=Portunus trituberculatus TaxID=210409 RepID=A0A5B7CIY4_PORTR|nr:hypothetical protein [Portunus trituberculatus]